MLLFRPSINPSVYQQRWLCFITKKPHREKI